MVSYNRRDMNGELLSAIVIAIGYCPVEINFSKKPAEQ
jgi:hypothetical protein